MAHKDIYLGIMTGTSVDAVDIIAARFNVRSYELLATLSLDIPKSTQFKLHQISESGQCHFSELAKLDYDLGHLYAKGCLQLIQKIGCKNNEITGIGSHGQTIWHQHSPHPFTYQIGNPHILNKLTQIPVIADFRNADMALGGQGAPLVPIFHEWLFKSTEVNRVVCNIGGMANISILASDPNSETIGFDTGPGNTLLDSWCREHKKEAFDENGHWARTGTCQTKLLEQMLNAPFFLKTGPKSCGRDYFNLKWVQKHAKNISPNDVQATLVELTCLSILNGINSTMTHDYELYICGGGLKNDYLMERLAAHLPSACHLYASNRLNIEADWLEAACFAWLAKQRLDSKLVHNPSITGASEQSLLGVIYQ